MKRPKTEYSLTFCYDSGGRGVLTVHNDSLLLCEAKARTGSIDKAGKLINSINPGTWTINEKSIDTAEAGMVYEPNCGWKVRLYNPVGEWTHYLIHPDGGKQRGNGTDDCIGLQGTFQNVRDNIDRMLVKQKTIPVYISKETIYGV